MTTASAAHPSAQSPYFPGPATMYSQHGHHVLGSSAAQHHHSSSGYGSSAASGHHTSPDSGLAPQSSFDTVPGSQHSSAMHQTPSSGSWSQGMHYSGSANGGGANAYGSTYSSGGSGGGYYGSGAGSQTPSGAVTGSAGAGYSGYGVQPHQQSAAASQHSMYSGHNSTTGGLSATALNGSNGSAHHSGSSTPTSQTPYHHQHPGHSMNSVFPSSQGYAGHHQQGGYYGSGAHGGASSNSVMSSPSYTSAPQYSTQLPLAGRHRVTTTLWEDEGTLCFQVDARGVCVARRHDNNMINGTKLLNVCGMSRGKRDGILKNEKERIVVKVGAMHLKGVWITFQRGKQLAEQNNILDVLYPLFETNIQSFLYHPDNYPRTAAVIAAAQERHAQRSRPSLGSGDSPTGYPRASSHSANGAPISGGGQQSNPPPLMRSNTTPNNLAGGAGAYGHSNGYSSAPNHSPSGHMGAPQSHSLHASPHTGMVGSGGGSSSGGGMPHRPPPVDRRQSPLNSVDNLESPYAAAAGGMFKHRTNSGFRRGMDEGTAEYGFSGAAYEDRV